MGSIFVGYPDYSHPVYSLSNRTVADYRDVLPPIYDNNAQGII